MRCTMKKVSGKLAYQETFFHGTIYGESNMAKVHLILYLFITRYKPRIA